MVNKIMMEFIEGVRGSARALEDETRALQSKNNKSTKILKDQIAKEILDEIKRHTT